MANKINQEPTATGLLPTDSVLVWEVTQTPHTRHATIGQVLGAMATLPASFSSVKIGGVSLVPGPSTAQFNTLNSSATANNTSLTSIQSRITSLQARVTALEGGGPLINITNIADQTVAAAFTVNGSLSGFSGVPVLQYADNAGAWLSLPGGASTTQTAYSFTHPAVGTATASMTVSVRNSAVTAQNRTSNAFAVIQASANLPGQPTGLSLISSANQSLTIGFAAPSSGGAFDSGSYQVQSKVHSASTWSAGPVIPYCTDGIGSFTDANNTVWDVRSGQIRTTTGGLTTVDPVTSGVTYLTMINAVIWQFVPAAGKGWYSASQPGGPWNGPSQVAPITSPGVQIAPLATGTPYDVEARAGNSFGFGAYSASQTFSTLVPGQEAFAIATIAQQYVGFPFTVSGSISNALSAPTMEYQDISGATIDAWTALPSGSNITQTSFSFSHPGAFVPPPSGSYTPPSPLIPSGAVVANIHPSLTAWANASFGVGQRCSTGGNAYECTNAGSSTSAPTGTGSNINNGGTATFKWLSAITFTSLQAWANTLNNTTLSASQAAVNWNNAVQTNAPGGFFMYLQSVTAGAFSVSITCAQGESFRDYPTRPLAFNQSNGCAYDAPNTSTPTVSPSFYWFIDCDNVTIDGWQFRSVSTNNATQIVGVDTKNGRHFTLRDCLVDGCAQAGDVEVLYCGNTNSGGTPGIANMVNCLVIDSQNNPGAGGAGMETIKWDFGVNGIAVNCTFISRNNSQWYAIKNLGGANQNQVRNCLFFGYGIPLLSQNTAGSIVADHCITNVANFTDGQTANGTGSLFGKSAVTQFISAANDFRLKTGADAIGTAVTDTTNNPVSDDIFGQGRGTTWDVGAHQFNTTSGSAPIAVAGMTVGVRDTNATNVTSTSNTFAVVTGAPPNSGNFTISGGKILRPDGIEFKAQGLTTMLSTATRCVQNSACFPVLSLMPNINIIGLTNQVGGGGLYYDAPTWISRYDQIVGWLTAKRIVVVIEDYTNTDNGNYGFATGQTLIDEANFLKGLASQYKNNPYVWFMVGPNEGTDNGAGGLSNEHKSCYDALRSVCTNLIGFCTSNNGQGWAGLNNSTGHYDQMTGVFWSFHPYESDALAPNVSNDVHSVAGAQAELNAFMALANGFVTSLDGRIPCIGGEFGNAYGNYPQPINGTNMVQQVTTYGPTICSGWIAWMWYWPGTPSSPDPLADNIVYPNNDGVLTNGYGIVLRDNMQAQYKAA